MHVLSWISGNWIEVFGAAAGIVYVFLEIRQNLWLWPVGIVTSAVYIQVFFAGKLYADMSLQVYYLVISMLGWYWWVKGTKAQGRKGARADRGEDDIKKFHSMEGLPGDNGGGREDTDKREKLLVTRLRLKVGLLLTAVFLLLFIIICFVLDKFTDSPVPAADSFITSLSIIATWMLARKIYEHWYLWIAVNTAASILFMTRGLYATVVLYIIYCIMSFAGLKAWKK